VQIDWLTVAAQIVNFLVLVWLLQRFLYRPITSAMRRREERIESRLAEAREARETAEAEERRLEEKEADLDARADAILASAREEAEELRERLERELREEMEEKRAAWRRHLAEERDALAEAAADAGATARVETGHALGTDVRRKLTRAIHEALSTDIDVAYSEDPELVMGLRLSIGDYAAEWSAARYLRRLETELGEMIDAGTGASEREDDAEDEGAEDNGAENGAADAPDRTHREQERQTQ
jgi:F-type H+-transporting ATPase subunit b